MPYKHFKGFTNTQCEFLPCHKGVQGEFNCLFCYCPLIDKECPGPYCVFMSKYGLPKKDCSGCKLPHDGIHRSWAFIQRWVPVAPLWDQREQSTDKIRKFSKLVRETFDESDIAWANQQEKLDV